MMGNAQVQRSTVAVNVGTVTTATTKDVTLSVPNAKFSTNPLLCDAVVMNPVAANSANVMQGECFVSTTGVVTVRFSNPSTANVAAGTAVSYKVDLIKATGSI
jgi:hypothetical protein